MKAFHIMAGLALLFLDAQSSLAQVGKYDKTHAVGKKSFNYLTEDTRKQKTYNNKDVHIISSDRDYNKAYAGSYAQRILSEQKLGAPFYAIGKKNGLYKVVAANQGLLGQPKGMFASLFDSGTHSKNTKKSPFVGWIDKNSALGYNRAFVPKDNNSPVRHRIGASTALRLSNIERLFTLDFLNLYDDPFFLDRDKGKLITGQVVYVYKYDTSKQAIFVSDRPSFSDSIRTALRWIPADPTAVVGQNHVYLLDANYPEFAGLPLGSKLLFITNGNWASMSTDQKAPINLSLSVWDRKKTYMLNVKGRNVAVMELDQPTENNGNISIHLVLFGKGHLLMHDLVSTFQGTSEKVSKDSQVKFSVTSVSQKGNRHLLPTTNFGKWVDYLAKIASLSTIGAANGYGFRDAINTIFKETPYSKFDNSVFVILDIGEFPISTSDINSEIHLHSTTLSLTQILSKDSMPYQDFILQSKQLLDNNTLEYTSFSGDYLCESKQTRSGSFEDMSTDGENVYSLDTPKDGVIIGGFVYPEPYSEPSSADLSNIFDSLFMQLNARNNELVNAIRSVENKYGVLRAIPTQEVANFCDSAVISVTDIEKSNINDLLSKKVQFTPRRLSTYDGGYPFDKGEMQNFSDSYHDLTPHISASSLRNQELAVLRNNSKRQSKLVNILSYRKAPNTKSSISKVYYHRVSVPSSGALSYIVRVKDIRRKKCNESGWGLAYREMLKKLINLKIRFKSGRLNTIYVAGKSYYFILLKGLP